MNFALAHSKFDEITPNFVHALLTGIICFSIFFVWREWVDVSQFHSELTSEYLFDLTTGTAMAVPNTNKGTFACGIFCTPQAVGTRMESGSDNTFVGQNSPFFLFFSLLPSLFFINYFYFWTQVWVASPKVFQLYLYLFGSHVLPKCRPSKFATTVLLCRGCAGTGPESARTCFTLLYVFSWSSSLQYWCFICRPSFTPPNDTIVNRTFVHRCFISPKIDRDTDDGRSVNSRPRDDSNRLIVVCQFAINQLQKYLKAPVQQTWDLQKKTRSHAGGVR